MPMGASSFFCRCTYCRNFGQYCLSCTFLALILTVPSLVIFIGIYFSTGDVVPGAWLLIGLAYSKRIFKSLPKIVG